MKNLLYFLFFIFFAIKGIQAQTDSARFDSIYVITSHPPKFNGDYRMLLQKNLKYPSDAVTKGIQGSVHVEFVIDTNGTITDLKIKQSIYPSLDEEALRVIRLTNGKWNPAFFEGKAVRFRKYMSINFALDPK